MKFYPSSLLIFITLALWLSCSCVVDAQISRQECIDQGGDVVGDIGNGAISQPDYLCATNDEAPSDTVVAQDGEPIASEGEVCCGGTGEGVFTGGGGGGLEDDGISVPSTAVRESLTRQECTAQGDLIVGDIGDGAIFQEDYLCERNGLAPTANISQVGEANAAIEGEVCCGSADSAEREELSRQECTDENGAVVGEIGDGAIHKEDYRCESNGLSPIGTIVALERESIASEGEVCCGPGNASLTTDEDAATSDGEPSGGPLFNQQNALRALQAVLASLFLFL